MELRPHDLVRLTAYEAIHAVDPPAWVMASLWAAPWVVVRRAQSVGGRVAVGVRGGARDRRFAAALDPEKIDAVAAPEDLAPGRPLWTAAKRRPHPVFDALEGLARTFDGTGLAWGPSGAAGYEIATGRPALTRESDLDVVARASSPDDVEALRSVVPAIRGAAIRVDLLVEIPQGAVSAGEMIGRQERLMLRTREGPRLVRREALFPVAC